jgi:hypothetical protein
MLDIKKLITGFLILALGASTAAWILSSATNPQNIGVSSVNGASYNTTTPSSDSDAFYQSQVSDVPMPSDETSSSSPNNLTDSVANAVVDGIVAANPNGFQTDENGNPSIAVPDDQTIADAIQNNTALNSITMPDWDTEVADLQGKIKTVSYSSTTATNYATNVAGITNSQFVKTGLNGMAQDGSLPSDESSVLSAGKLAASHTLSGVLALSVPAPFVDYQKSLVKMLVYEKDLAELTQNISGDPALTAVILQAKENDYLDAIQQFNNQGQKLNNALVAYGDPQNNAGALVSFLDSVFFINKAEAVIPVTDWLAKVETALASTADISNAWARFFATLAKDMALQIVKNMLMALVQQKVLAYIQGSGAPRFVTDAATAAVNAAEMSALGAINKNFSCISVQAMPRISVLLKALYKPGNNACAAQFQSQLSSANLTNFYNNFASGGFVTFATTLQPSNYFYGGFWDLSQQAGQSAKQGVNLLNVKTTASQGFSNAEQCADNSNPNGSHWECYGAGGSADWAMSGGAGSSDYAVCIKDGDDPEEVPNAGKCSSGKDPTVTMPGIINKSSLDSALDSHPKLIAAANSIAGIINAAASSLIMGLVNQGIMSATQAFSGALTDGGLTSINPATITASVATSTVSIPLSCTPATSTLEAPSVETSFFANGGTYNANGIAPTYSWLSSDGRIGAGSEFDIVYNATGTYTVSLSDSAGDATTTCAAVINNDANQTSTATF